MLANTRRLVEAGARIVAGTDAGIGPGKPHDVCRFAMPQLRDLGMDAAQALRTVTSVAARVCGLADRARARVAAGFDADLLAVDGDPLTDPEAIQPGSWRYTATVEQSPLSSPPRPPEPHWAAGRWPPPTKPPLTGSPNNLRNRLTTGSDWFRRGSPPTPSRGQKSRSYVQIGISRPSLIRRGSANVRLPTQSRSADPDMSTRKTRCAAGDPVGRFRVRVVLRARAVQS